MNSTFPTPASPLPTKPIRIASRGSMLALWQANYVARCLQKFGAQTEIQVIKTTGDRVQDRFLHEIGGKGLFIKELEQALLEGHADIAVHSLKDMPAQIKDPFHLPAILKRHSPHDLLIVGADLARRLSHHSIKCGDTLSPEDLVKLGVSRIATGSLRRQAMLARFARNLTPAPVRGNVDTRLRKLLDGEWDGMILAEASLDRLELKSHHNTYRLDGSWFIPCAAQGALAIESRQDSKVSGFVREVLNDSLTEHAVTLERRLLALLGGDCTMPFGCLTRPQAGESHATGESHSVGPWSVGVSLYTPSGDCAEVDTTLAGFEKSPSAPLHLNTEWSEASAQSLLAQLRSARGPEILKSLGLPLPTGWLD